MFLKWTKSRCSASRKTFDSTLCRWQLKSQRIGSCECFQVTAELAAFTWLCESRMLVRTTVLRNLSGQSAEQWIFGFSHGLTKNLTKVTVHSGERLSKALVERVFLLKILYSFSWELLLEFFELFLVLLSKKMLFLEISEWATSWCVPNLHTQLVCN